MRGEYYLVQEAGVELTSPVCGGRGVDREVRRGRDGGRGGEYQGVGAETGAPGEGNMSYNGPLDCHKTD